jgi:hypothetical protein
MRPTSSSFGYVVTCALVVNVPTVGPKSTAILYEGLRASGKSSTETIRPVRRSRLKKSSIVMSGFFGSFSGA